MIEKTKYQGERLQGTQRSSLTRSIDEIATSAGTDQESVLKAANDLGIPASDGSSHLFVQDAGKIYAHLLPAPEKPRAKVPRAEKSPPRDVPAQAQSVADPTQKAEGWVPLRNPIHSKQDRMTATHTYSSSKKRQPPVAVARPEPSPMGALIPPKPPRVRTRAIVTKPEIAPTTAGIGIEVSVLPKDVQPRRTEDPIIDFAMPEVDSYDPFDLYVPPCTKSLLDLLQNFSPRDYGRLFLYLNQAISLDLQVRPLIVDKHPGISEDLLSNTAELKFLQNVCSYRYGIFGYKESTRLVARDARIRLSKNLPDTAEAVCRLRPMLRGLMTDEAGQRFIAWNVDPEIKRIQTVAFEDLEQWLRGLLTGRYVRLKTILIDVDNPARDSDRETLNFMAVAAKNLRTSIQFFRLKQNPTRNPSRGKGSSPTSKNAHLGTKVTFRDHSRFLVPITIDDTGETYFGLGEGFFDHPAAAPLKHEVRAFMRRAPGTPWDAPKTVFVPSHTRGGTIFDDARKPLPAVSIIQASR